MPPSPSETQVLEACRVLFGRQVRLSADFLLYLQPGGVKSAYRKRAKETHPDLCLSASSPSQRNDSFREVAQAYRLLCDYLQERGHRPQPLRFYARPAAERTSSSPPSGGKERVVDPSIGVTEIGLWLYRRGIIPLPVLAEALVWQRRQRPALGQIARRWGWLSDQALQSILESRVPFARFGEKAVRLGLLTPTQVRTLLFFQRSQQKRLGQFFVERGYVSAEEMERHVVEMNQHNSRARTGSASPPPEAP